MSAGNRRPQWGIGIILIVGAILLALALVGCRKAVTDFGDGQWRIGVQMPTGHYEARVPEYSRSGRAYDCLFYVTAQLDHPSEGISSNGGEPSYGKVGQVVEIDIDAGDGQQALFLTDGCGTWHRVR